MVSARCWLVILDKMIGLTVGFIQESHSKRVSIKHGQSVLLQTALIQNLQPHYFNNFNISNISNNFNIYSISKRLQDPRTILVPTVLSKQKSKHYSSIFSSQTISPYYITPAEHNVQLKSKKE